MSSINPFVVSILSKKDIHPLQAASSVSGYTMKDLPTSATFDFSPPSQFEPLLRNTEVVETDFLIPSKSSNLYDQLPLYLQLRKGSNQNAIQSARNTLWQRINWREKRQDSQFARLIELPCPPLETQELMALGRQFAQYLADQGMIVDIGLHKNIQGQSGQATSSHTSAKHTFQMMCTTRDFENGEFGNKNRTWNQKETMIQWRTQWFTYLDKALENTQSSLDLSFWKSLTKRYLNSTKISTLNPNPEPSFIQAVELDQLEDFLQNEDAKLPAPKVHTTKTMRL